jgi:hypothetical protein
MEFTELTWITVDIKLGMAPPVGQEEQLGVDCVHQVVVQASRNIARCLNSDLSDRKTSVEPKNI